MAFEDGFVVVSSLIAQIYDGEYLDCKIVKLHIAPHNRGEEK